MSMRYHELLEAPIDQYAALGDWEDRKGSFNSSNSKETTDKIVGNPKAVAKIRNIWQRVPQTFNFYLINVPGREFEHEITDVGNFKNKRLAPYMDQMKLSPTAINVIYTTNFTNQSNYMPMTAWIMAHRLWHIFQFEHEKAPPVKHNVDILLSDAFVDTFNGYTGQEHHKGKNFFMLSSAPWNISECIQQLIPKVFTMRSARMNNLKNELDVPAELIAQYLVTGKVTFAPLPDQLEIDRKAYPLPSTQLNGIWSKLAVDLENEFNSLLNTCIGKVLVL